MDTTKLSAKGQIVLPKRVRDAHGWAPGAEFVVENTAVGVLLRPKSQGKKGRIADAAGMLVISSGCHAVAGYCGSGVRVYALHDAMWIESAARADVAPLYLHALNPYGFSHIRRVTHENLDLNRNFGDYDQPLPVNQV